MSQPAGGERRVVPFAVPPSRVRRRLMDVPAGPGAILLFTGVRYERPGQATAVPPPREAGAALDPRTAG